MKALRWLNQNLSLSIPVFLLLGLLAGGLLPNLNYALLITPLTLLMVYPMMVNLKPRQLLSLDNKAVQGLALGINFLIIPFIAYGLGWLFFADEPQLALGLLLAALLPTSGMTISWTGFAKGNVSAAVKLTLVGLFLGSILTPFYVYHLMGAQLSVDLGLVFTQVLLFIVIPLVAGQTTRILLIKKHGQEKFQQKLAPRFPVFSTLGVLGIVFVAMALAGMDLVQQPAFVLYLLLPIILLYAINFSLSTGIARKFLDRGNGIALVYGTVMRNLSIALALSMTAFGEAGTQAALLIAVAYIVQVQSAALYVKFTPRIFGEAQS